MIAILVSMALMGQVKQGDDVYVKVESARAWRSLGHAVNQYKEGPISTSLAADRMTYGTSPMNVFGKNTKGTIVAVQYVDSEQYVKFRVNQNSDWWMRGEDLRELDDVAKASIARDEITDKLRPFCITKPDHAALAIAIGKGLDPITMTSEQAAALSPGQRKSLAGIKARYLKSKKSTGR